MILKRKCASAAAALCTICASAAQAQLAVTTVQDSGLTPNELFQQLAGAGSGVSNVNCTLVGSGVSAGTFTGGSVFGIDNGVSLSSGSIANALGPNVSDSNGLNNGLGGDPDLQSLIPAFTVFDATVLECTFACPAGAQLVSFQYVFGSDEYNEFANTNFNDVFGWFFNGANIAVLPDGVTPVSINNVNGGNPAECFDTLDNDADGAADALDTDCTASGDNIVGEGRNNPAFYLNNDCSDPDGLPACSLPTEVDGMTTVLAAQGNVVSGSNTIKLAIGDAGDSVYDSWVFISGGSFSCAGIACGNGVVDAGEQCDDGNASDADACSTLCLLTTCGDGITQVPNGNGTDEQCDDGNGVDGDGCNNDCTITPVCGDGIINQLSEACDGASDAECPGLCQPDCTCAVAPGVCGDNSVNQPGETCDGTDDAACPGLCQIDCTCPAPPAVCGDNAVNQPGETCDGTDDAACPGLCQIDCTCAVAPVCGDGLINQPGEVCDGGSDAACPGQCQADCTCPPPPPVCGDNSVNQLSEECDGTDDSACPGLCQLDCTCSANPCPPGYNPIFGTVTADLIFGTSGNDCIYGYEGDDTIYGEGGDDLIYGGFGNDTIYGNGGVDSIYGEGGKDLIKGGKGDDLISGGPGNDNLSGDTGNDTVHGDEHDDVIYGNAGNDSLFGDDGNDRIYGASGDDTCSGGAGDDKVHGGADNDSLDGNSGTNGLNGGDGVDACVNGVASLCE